MIPILYDTGENTFVTNGLGRLPDCIECVVFEERNGLYECDFSYPVDGLNYEKIKVGRIIAVSHDESGDVQPFDIVSFTRPINGVVTFHCTHISYRQCYMTASGSGINSLASAFSILSQASPSNPFTYETDKTSVGYLGAGDGLPHSVRAILGGVEGSILDSYGGEYEWNKWRVILHSARGKDRDITIRYGINMLDYNEDFSTEGAYSSCVPYWTDGIESVVGDRVTSYGTTITGRGECVPLDLSDKFETKPTKTELENLAGSYLSNNQPYLPAQTLHIEFIRLQDTEEFKGYKGLMRCNLCDTVTVYFPEYVEGKRFKIVKVEWDVLLERYISMELGDLSMSLSEALGLSNEPQAPSSILNQIYPVGSIYISTNSVSPSALFGGTWQRIQGRFLLATGTPDSNNDNHFGAMSGESWSAGVKTKGGQDYHQLTVSEMPSHTHRGMYSSGTGTSAGMAGVSTNNWYANGYNENTGGDGAHNNMPPYYAVYMWERTA